MKTFLQITVWLVGYSFGYANITNLTIQATSLNGQYAQAILPAPFDVSQTHNILVYHHGVGEDGTAPLGDSLKTNMIWAIVSNGWIVVSGDAHRDNWGNQDSLDDYERITQWSLTNFNNSGKIVLMSQSMGGCSGLLSTTNIHVIGWFGIYPVCNLSNMFTTGYSGSIKTAFGISSDGSDYNSKTDGHDPALLAGSRYSGLRMRFYSSYGDATVYQSQNTDVMTNVVAGFAVEFTNIECTGNHGDISHFKIPDVLDFLSRCVPSGLGATMNVTTLNVGTIK